MHIDDQPFLSGCGSDDDDLETNVDISTPENIDDVTSEARISSYAELKEITLEESKRRLLVMDNAYKAFPAIDEHLRDSGSSIYFDGEDDFGLTVRTTRKEELLSILDENLIKRVKDETGMPLRIKNGALMNPEELQEMLTNKTEELSEKIEGFQTMGYDPMNDSVVIKVYDTSISSIIELEQKYSLKDISGINVDFQLLNSPITPATLIGGGQLRTFDGSTPIGRCTAGFSAFTSDGTPAMITAFHCLRRTNFSNGANNAVYTDDDGITHNLSLVNSLPSANHDMALFSAAPFTPIAPRAYLSSIGFGTQAIVEKGTKQSLKTGFFNTLGQEFLCHNGRTTGFSCGEVKLLYIGVQAVYDGVKLCTTSKKSCNSTFIAISGSTLKCGGGDSGGPVFSRYVVDDRKGGYAAYGILSACDNTLVRPGEDITVYLSSLDFISELPATLALFQQ